jgi:cobalamin biosynthesis Mg chelatase CobN
MMRQAPFSTYLSLTMEKPISTYTDQLVYIALNWAQFEPLPPSVKRFAVALVSEPASQQMEIPYVKLDLSNP